LRTLHEDREVTRLGASVFASGLVSPEAMAATLRALKRFQRAVQQHGVDQIRVVATSATRDARNAAAFQAWVKAETGWNMETISGLEEGRLIHHGLMSEPGTGGKVLLIDLGGGSCEITLSEHKRIKETTSLPLGAVRLTEEFLQADPASAEDLARMRRLIARELRRAHRKIQPGRVQMVIATSGTAAASVKLKLSGIGAARLSSTSKYSACASPEVMPNTRSPFLRSRTSSPMASISPANSSPGIFGEKPGGGGYLPSRCIMSARFSPAARTRIKT